MIGRWKLVKLKRKSIFNILYTAYLINMVFEESNFSMFSPISVLLSGTRFLILLLLILLAATMNTRGYKSILISMVIWSISSAFNMILKSSGIRLMIMILLIYCSRCSTMEEIFRNGIKTLTTVSLFIIICSQIGIVEDSINIRYSHDFLGRLFSNGRYVRHSFGFLFSNQVPFFLMIIYFLVIVRYKEFLGLWKHICIQILNSAVFIYCGSRTIFLLIFLMGILCFMVHVKNCIISKKTKRLKFCGGIVVFPLCCAFSILISYFYNESLYFLNVMSNFRISNAQKAMRAYGLHFLSADVSAGTHVGVVDVIVDNGYVMLMLREGVIIGILVIMFWTYIGYVAEKNHNDYLKIVLLVFAVSNLIDYHLLSYRVIPLLCILLNKKDPLLGGNQSDKNNKRKKREVLIC